MWTPTEEIVVAALAHAEKCAPLEGCGVVADGRFHPLANLTTEHDSFVMDMRGYVTIARTMRIDAIVHSHLNVAPDPSAADRAICEKIGLPWLIVSWPSCAWRVIEPDGWKAPLIGRIWVWGAQDCFSIIRDGMLEYAGIAIADFEREWEFWLKGNDPIADNFVAAGFRLLPPATPPRHCDVFGMRMMNAPVANHLALFLAPDFILHHLIGRLSGRQLYDGFFQKMTVMHLRHERLM